MISLSLRGMGSRVGRLLCRQVYSDKLPRFSVGSSQQLSGYSSRYISRRVTSSPSPRFLAHLDPKISFGTRLTYRYCRTARSVERMIMSYFTGTPESHNDNKDLPDGKYHCCDPSVWSLSFMASLILQLIKSSGKMSPWPVSSCLKTSIVVDLSFLRILQTPSPVILALRTRYVNIWESRRWVR